MLARPSVTSDLLHAVGAAAALCLHIVGHATSPLSHPRDVDIIVIAHRNRADANNA
jgi:hypothetical protein